MCLFVANTSLWLILGEGVVWVAVQPTLAAFGRGDYRMTGRTRVLRCVLVGRAVATTCSAALLTGAQVKPAITSLYTVFTNPLFRLLNFRNFFDVNAYFCCHPASIQPAVDR